MADRFTLVGGKLLDGTSADITVVGGKIAAFGSAPRRTGDIYDIGNATIAPGFVDIQINGSCGVDVTQAPELIWELGEMIRQFGTTAILPTLVSTDLDVIDTARRIVTVGPPPGYTGAAVWGLHVEGPFLSPQRIGAHDPSKRRDPDPALVEDWSPETGVAMVTLAPELDGALPTIRTLVDNGVVVALGHSDATYEEALAGFEAGATAVTHLYNAMSGSHHRTPGLVTAALAHDNVVAGLIVDNVHLHPGTVRAVFRTLGPGRIALVTDATAAAGAAATAVLLGSMEATIDDAPRLASGVLAGSLLTMDAALANFIAATGCSLAEAVTTVTATPRRLFGRPDSGFEIGTTADFTLVDAVGTIHGTVIGPNMYLEKP